LEVVLWKDLSVSEPEGFPVASDFVDKAGESYSFSEYTTLSAEKKAECEMRFFYLPNYHEVYVGTSGSGKTTGCCEPQLRAVSSQKNKPNLFISDPKGELFDRNAKHLKEQGYKIFVLNFKDTTRSDRWNPLAELYDLKMESQKAVRDVEEIRGAMREELVKMPPFDEYNDIYYRSGKYAFPSKAAVNAFVQVQGSTYQAQLASLVNQMASNMILIQCMKDPSWEYGSLDLLRGLFLCLLEEATDEKSGFTRDMFTLSNIDKYYQELRRDLVDKDGNLSSHYLLRDKPKHILTFMSTALNNAPNTKKSYCGVFTGQFAKWTQAHIKALTAGSTIDIENYNDDENPFVIFLVTRDYDKSDFMIAGLFVDWVYRTMLKKAEERPDGRNKRPFHFLLDEFGNIPPIKDFDNKISTARSRNIWFHLIVQSYKQIELVYDLDGPPQGRSTVIRDNCNSQIFLGAQNRATKEQFSNECGKHSIPTLSSVFREDDNNLTEAPCVPVSELDLIKPGEMYVKRIYKPVFTSRFIRSYEAASVGIFKNFSGGLESELPFCVDSFDSPKYTFDLEEKKKKKPSFRFDDDDF
jgi:type IV secretion system protein VirD4